MRFLFSGKKAQLALRNNPNRVNDARNIAQQSKNNIDPELATNPDLQKDANRR